MSDEMRDKIAKLIWCEGEEDDTGWETSYSFNHKDSTLYIIADEILSLETDTLRIAVVRKEGELPFPTNDLDRKLPTSGSIIEAYRLAQQEMGEKGYVQEVKP